MKFLCLVHFAPDAFAGFSAEDGRILTDATIEHDHQLRAGGHLLMASPLAAPERGATIQRRRRHKFTDGPFAETKEVVGGFVLIEADDLDAAVALMEQSPIAPHSRIDIRPLAEGDTHSQTGQGRPGLAVR